MKSHVVLFILFVSFSVGSFGQEQTVNRISTDRPLQSETPIVVPKKHLQFELGAQFSKTSLHERPNVFTNEDSDNQTEYRYHLPDLLIKYGLSHRLELQLGFTYRYLLIDWHSRYRNYFMDFDYPVNGRSHGDGIESPVVGAKYQFLKTNENGKGSNLSLSTRFAIPIYSIYAENELRITSRLTWNKTITGSWYVTTGLGFSHGNQLNSNGIALVQTGVQLWHFMTIAGEYYQTAYRDRFSHQTTYYPNVDGALIFALGQNHQLDISAGTSAIGKQVYLYDSRPDNYSDFFIGIGYSCRLGL